MLVRYCDSCGKQEGEVSLGMSTITDPYGSVIRFDLCTASSRNDGCSSKLIQALREVAPHNQTLNPPGLSK